MANVKTALSRRAAYTSGALMAYLRPKMAADAKLDLKPIIAGVTGKDWAQQKAKLVTALDAALKGKLAKDADVRDLAQMLDQLEEGVNAEDDLPDEMMTGDDDPDAETEEERKERLAKRAKDKAARDKAAKDADKPDDKKDDDKVEKKAMDAAIAAAEKRTVERLNAIREAERAVRPYIGELAMAQDSADAVYKLAFDSLGVDVAGVDPSAFPAMLRLIPKPGDAPRPKLATDAAGAADFTKRFPDAARIKHV